MATRTIRLYGDDILRKKCRLVETVDNKIKEILEDMTETLHATDNGAALAAPQVGILKRLVVIDMGGKLYKLVNPQIISSSGEQEVYEGCLSIPDKYGKLMRPKYVRVSAKDENGKDIIIEAQDELAKCFCHEIDHLDGVLFIDKVIEYV